MKKTLIAMAVGAAAMLALPQVAAACTTDTDCKVCYRCALQTNGSKKCIKRVKGATDRGTKCTAAAPTGKTTIQQASYCGTSKAGCSPVPANITLN